MWVEAMQVSRQALSQRLQSLPAQLFIGLFEQVDDYTLQRFFSKS